MSKKLMSNKLILSLILMVLMLSGCSTAAPDALQTSPPKPLDCPDVRAGCR